MISLKGSSAHVRLMLCMENLFGVFYCLGFMLCWACEMEECRLRL